MHIKSASVAVQQQSQLWIEWKRGSHSSKTEKHTVSPDTGEIIFSNYERGFPIKVSMFKNDDGSWRPDLNQLILYCGDDAVGVCDFDLS